MAVSGGSDTLVLASRWRATRTGKVLGSRSGRMRCSLHLPAGGNRGHDRTPGDNQAGGGFETRAYNHQCGYSRPGAGLVGSGGGPERQPG
jgi:hypothetical protein